VADALVFSTFLVLRSKINEKDQGLLSDGKVYFPPFPEPGLPFNTMRVRAHSGRGRTITRHRWSGVVWTSATHTITIHF